MTEKLFKITTLGNYLFYICTFTPLCIMFFNGTGSREQTRFFIRLAFGSHIFGWYILCAMMVYLLISTVLNKKRGKDYGLLMSLNFLHIIFMVFTVVISEAGFPSPQ